MGPAVGFERVDRVHVLPRRFRLPFEPADLPVDPPVKLAEFGVRLAKHVAAGEHERGRLPVRRDQIAAPGDERAHLVPVDSLPSVERGRPSAYPPDIVVIARLLQARQPPVPSVHAPVRIVKLPDGQARGRIHAGRGHVTRRAARVPRLESAAVGCALRLVAPVVPVHDHGRISFATGFCPPRIARGR